MLCWPGLVEHMMPHPTLVRIHPASVRIICNIAIITLTNRFVVGCKGSLKIITRTLNADLITPRGTSQTLINIG